MKHETRSSKLESRFSKHESRAKSLFSILERLHFSDSVTFLNRLLFNVVTARGGYQLLLPPAMSELFLILSSIYSLFYMCHEPDSLLNDQFLLFCT